MVTTIPEPGTIIRITSGLHPIMGPVFLGKEFEIMECPDHIKHTQYDRSHYIWVVDFISKKTLRDIALWPPNFEIIRPTTEKQRNSSTCQICGGTGKITLLTSDVDCECHEG